MIYKRLLSAFIGILMQLPWMVVVAIYVYGRILSETLSTITLFLTSYTNLISIWILYGWIFLQWWTIQVQAIGENGERFRGVDNHELVENSGL